MQREEGEGAHLRVDLGLKMASLPIPTELLGLLEAQGYDTLYPPQEAAVNARVLEGRSLLLTTPTASGKTLVAILAAGKVVLERGGKVVYLTPLRALAGEKYGEFKIFESLRKPDGSPVRVMISTGDYDSSSEYLAGGDIIVLTNEKFDSLLRHGATWIEGVKLFVADEVHLVGDPHRGPTIETILTKITAFTPTSQILALSATVSNSKVIAEWLSSHLIDMEWRPVRLVEGVYVDGEIYFSDRSKRAIDATGRGEVIDVAVDAVKEGGQSLIFTETRRRSVSLALKAAEVTSHYLTEEEKREVKALTEEILSSGEETELSRKLVQAVEKGAAFHHAGLYAGHRRLVEEGFKSGVIKILTATPTLAAGVNLPARRVVLSSLYRYDSEYGGQAPISILEYKQMCGRAGRPKFDTVGETVLLARTVDEADDLYGHYVKGRPEPLRSQLSREGALRTHILATVAALPGMREPELFSLFSKTLFATQYRGVTVKAKVRRALDFLTSELLLEKRGERLAATEFGKRISQLYIDPATGIGFRRAVRSAEGGTSHTAGILHLVVTSPDFTPKFPLRSGDWDEAALLVDEHQGEFLTPVPGERDFEEYEEFIRGFRSLMVLKGWIGEYSEDKMLQLYGVEPGDLHRAVENGDWLLYSLGEICRMDDRIDLFREVSELRLRVKYGVKRELIPLTSLEGVGRVRARALYTAGFTDLEKLRSASQERLAEVSKIGPAVARRIKEQLTGHVGER